MPAPTTSTSSMIPDIGDHAPEDRDQRVVVTPYGEGLVLRTRPNGMREIELRDWKMQQELTRSTNCSKNTNNEPQSSGHAGGPGRPATLYSPTSFPSVAPEVGSDVLCRYGRGRVTGIRRDNGMVVVRLSSWRLSRRNTVTCYLRASEVQVVRPKKPYEMSVVEKVEGAAELKQRAAQQFKHKFYKEALKTYSKAVDMVKFVQHKTDSSNAVRADLVVVMITCSNNAATCCSQLRQWEEAHQHAQHSTALIEVLERKIKEGVSKIHQELLAAGHSDIQVFGEWKVKSLILTARALIEKGDFTEATEAIKLARETIEVYIASSSSSGFSKNTQKQQHAQSVKHLQSNDKELQKLLSVCRERRKAQLKKEKQRAKAMFGSTAVSTGTMSSSSTSASASNERASRPSNSEEKKADPAETISDVKAQTMPRRPSLKKSDDATRDSSPRTVITPSGNDDDAARIPIKKKVSFADDIKKDDEDDYELVWHQDPAFLGGLGVVIGVVGTLLVLSQLVGHKRK